VAKIRKIEICISNAKLGSGAVLDWVKSEHPIIRTKQWGCLGHCHRCLHVPYVLIDDETFVEAQSEAELRAKLEARLRADG